MSAACCRPHPAPEPTLGRAIPGPNKLLDLAEGVALPPGDYSTTPGGTLFGTTPGGGELRTLSYITLLDATDYSSHNPSLASGNGKLLRNGSYKAYALNGGTRIIYDRKFLMACRNSPVAKTPPCNLPDIPGVTNPSMDELQTDINFMSADDEKPGLGEEAQFDIDI